MRVLLHEVGRGCLQVLQPVLRLAEAHQVLIVKGRECGLKLEASRCDRPEPPRRRSGKMTARFR